MSLPRAELQTIGWLVAQMFGPDIFGQDYDRKLLKDTRLPGLYAARYVWAKDSNGIPIFQHAVDPNTGGAVAGPLGNWIYLPAKKAQGPSTQRPLGQWAQVFAAKITTLSPLKATPVHDVSPSQDGKSIDTNLDANLGEISVGVVDGLIPSVGTLGMVVAGTDLGAQQALFFSFNPSRHLYVRIIGPGLGFGLGATPYYAFKQIQYPWGPLMPNGLSDVCEDIQGFTGQAPGTDYLIVGGMPGPSKFNPANQISYWGYFGQGSTGPVA